jgi:cytochrome b involved in lipid metabolism
MDNARRKEEKEEGAKKKEVKKEEVRIFTKAEVAKHDTVHDCWMIINGKVYDVTPFVDEHPGGDILMDVRYAPPPRPLLTRAQSDD